MGRQIDGLVGRKHDILWFVRFYTTTLGGATKEFRVGERPTQIRTPAREGVGGIVYFFGFFSADFGGQYFRMSVCSSSVIVDDVIEYTERPDA